MCTHCKAVVLYQILFCFRRNQRRVVTSGRSSKCGEVKVSSLTTQTFHLMTQMFPAKMTSKLSTSCSVATDASCAETIAHRVPNECITALSSAKFATLTSTYVTNKTRTHLPEVLTATCERCLTLVTNGIPGTPLNRTQTRNMRRKLRTFPSTQTLTSQQWKLTKHVSDVTWREETREQ